MKAQVIICKCGAKFAACREPECYSEAEWQKDMRKYIKKGCSVEFLDCKSFTLERCKCNKQPMPLFN